MTNKNLVFIGILFMIFLYACKEKQSGTTVVFPEIEEAVQITENGKEHFFASYYGINSFSLNERYVTVLETDLKYKLPDENEPATLGLVDLETNEFTPLAKTRAWNFQQGCMAHWLGTSPDSLIIYNDIRKGKNVSVIMNVHTRKEIKTIPYPVAAVSPNGKKAVSINFSRLRLTRPDYGYGGNGQDAKADVVFPEDDGLFVVDLETDDAELIVSMADVKDMVPEIKEGNIEYFTHTLFSRSGSKIMWFGRAIGTLWKGTTPFTVNTDGSNLQTCFPDGWYGSHFDWLNDNELMITGRYEGKQVAHILFTAGKQNYKRLGNGMLDYDGHGTFSPDGKWMLTDTPARGEAREHKIYLMDMKTEAVLSLGRFYEPKEFSGFWRCDIHCRWSPSGKLIGFNSTHTGSRQVYVFKILN